LVSWFLLFVSCFLYLEIFMLPAFDSLLITCCVICFIPTHRGTSRFVFQLSRLTVKNKCMYTVKIISISNVTHNVKRFRYEKPEDYHFNPGQATEVSINKQGWEEERRPFTFTSLNDDPYLEFTIKIYRDHDGVTNELGKLVVGDELIIRDVWGAIEYKGPGYFIAGGAGVTPFIAILRQLHKENKLQDNTLFFSNRTSKDIILENEFNTMLGKNAVYTLTNEQNEKYLNERINEDFLKKHVEDFNKNFYACGPDSLVQDITNILKKLGAVPDALVFEK
jgi:ferredoxin-NADP reductase